jgi:16S rRNA G527 N7-methylase RsmG
MIDIKEKDFTSRLTKVFSENKLSSYLSIEVMDKFYRLTVRMLEENEKYNLTAITDPDKIILPLR